MTEQSKIEWCDSTFNGWTGCAKISPACDHCYAESWSKRAGSKVGKWGPGAPRVRTSAANWRLPIKWNAAKFMQCIDCGWRGDVSKPDPVLRGRCPNCLRGTLECTRRRVFCASLADVFDNEVDPQWRRALLKLIAETPNLDWLILTKRIGNVMPMLTEIAESKRSGSHAGDLLAHHWRNGTPPANVWLGITICNQAEADRDIPKLLAVPARVRFLSIEPMLGQIDLRFHFFSEPTGRFRTQNGKRQMELAKQPDGGIHWVICGGESGPHARPMHPDWARSLRDQCAQAGVAFFMKQMGGVRDKRGDLSDLPEGLRIREFPNG